MKFGELLAASLISGWEAHYFDYWALKEYIKRHTMEMEGRKPKFDHQEFISIFQKEVRRVVLFVNGKLAEIVNELEFETTKFTTFNEGAWQQLGAQLIRFDRFVNDALSAQTKILKKYRKWTGQETAGWIDEKKSEIKKAKNIVHSLIVAMSHLSERQWESGSDWVPPESFCRKTVKYWVRPEHAVATKLFVIQHVPILEVNKTPFPPRSIDGDGEDHSQIHNYLSSVYMDNDEAACYHHRIAQEEGANLLRVRWYGGVEGKDGLPRPDAGSVFFMELKTHHDPEISGLKSTKERFPITAQMIPGFMSGKLTVDQVIDAMIAQGQIKPGKAEEQKDLAKFIQNMIVTLKLKPWIRTVYHRTAFQRSDSNEVRLSFDLPLILHSEIQNWNGKDWLDLFKVDNSDAAPFGYGVLEVKTSDEPPQWVEELLQTGWLIKVEKFSKFQHATAIFHPHSVKILPYWINSDIAKQIGEEQPDLVDKLVQKTMHHAEGPASPTLDLHLSTPPASMGRDSPLRVQHPARWKEEGASSEREPLLLSLNGDDDKRSVKSDVRAEKRKWFSGRESPTSPTKTVTIPPIPVQAPPPPRGTNLTRMRIEPKVFFANERTFLKWMFAVVILISVSMTVMSLSSHSIPYGITLLGIGCILILYALGLYKWRLNKILAREGSRFDDRIGPFVISFCLIAAACVVLVFAWQGGDKETFVCNVVTVPYPPMQLETNISSVEVAATESYSAVSTTVQRLQACLSARAVDGQDKTKKLTPDVTWDVLNVFLIPSTSSLTDMYMPVYVKYDSGEGSTVLNFRNDTNQFAMLAHNVPQGTVSYDMRAYGPDYFTYATVTAAASGPPTDAQDLYNLFKVAFFPSNFSFTSISELRSRYKFSNVRIADTDAAITVRPQFHNADDRALQVNSYDIRVQVEFAITATNSVSYSSLRQAQSLLLSMVQPDQHTEVIHTQWK